jgi:CheY-like chemotaxis protein
MAALQSEGAEVIAAQTLEDAILACNQKNVSAAVLDIKLKKGIDCATVCRYLQKRHVPFIFRTAYTKPVILREFPGIPVLGKIGSTEPLVKALVRAIMGER